MAEQLGKVDHSVLRVNQASIILALLAAFIFNLPWLTAAVAVVMLVGTAIGKAGFFLLYTRSPSADRNRKAARSHRQS